MALLGAFRRLPVLTLLAALLLLVASGCVLMESLGMWARGPTFSHALHGELGLDCMDCHAGPEAGEPAPAEAVTCDLCHEDMDAEKPPELRAAALFADGAPAGHDPGADLIFSHALHGELGLACADCHGEVAESDAVDDGMMPRMEDCMFCHGEDPGAEGDPDGCARCHEDIRRDRMPPNHERQWQRLHGQIARSGSDATADDCSMCHSQEACTECHRITEPANHNNTWRLRGHGLVAAMDRDNCATCHQSDSCDRCHEDTLPISHHGSFGAPKSTHCFSCHVPLQQTSCFTCHKSAPSHFDAAPKPPDHSPGLNCRQCHGVDVALPHVDGGQDCNICHK
jgi:hypothetical protein